MVTSEASFRGWGRAGAVQGLCVGHEQRHSLAWSSCSGPIFPRPAVASEGPWGLPGQVSDCRPDAPLIPPAHPGVVCVGVWGAHCLFPGCFLVTSFSSPGNPCRCLCKASLSAVCAHFLGSGLLPLSGSPETWIVSSCLPRSFLVLALIRKWSDPGFCMVFNAFQSPLECHSFRTVP